jgi:hypothetical protein
MWAGRNFLRFSLLNKITAFSWLGYPTLMSVKIPSVAAASTVTGHSIGVSHGKRKPCNSSFFHTRGICSGSGAAPTVDTAFPSGRLRRLAERRFWRGGEQTEPLPVDSHLHHFTKKARPPALHIPAGTGYDSAGFLKLQSGSVLGSRLPRTKDGGT